MSRELAIEIARSYRPVPDFDNPDDEPHAWILDAVEHALSLPPDEPAPGRETLDAWLDESRRGSLVPTFEELRERARCIAVDAARMSPESYFVEPFTPHRWVVDAVAIALRRGALDVEVEARNEERAFESRLEQTRGWCLRDRIIVLRGPATGSALEICDLMLREIDERVEERDRAIVATSNPVPMILSCPTCSARHIDVTMADKPHHTHACQNCGMVWRPALVPTVGVQFLPGFKD